MLCSYSQKSHLVENKNSQFYILRLTPDVCVCAVHHVCGMDEIVARTLPDQLHLREAQDQLPSDGKGRNHSELGEAGSRSSELRSGAPAYLESMPMGLKSSRCLV